MQASKDSTEARKVITIMADIGNGPYAWLNDPADERSGVGGNIADAVCGFGGDLPVSTDLERGFAEWVMFFEHCYDQPDFDWPEFHARGMALTRRLHSEIGDSFRVFYEKPFEDPSHDMDSRIEVRSEPEESG
jgi:hypothetical protein